MPKVTIEDISRQTGLSRGTVSRALNDRPDISQQTKLRVLEACRELNYVPSQAARSLATGRNYAVGVVIDDLDNPYDAAFLRGVMRGAEGANYAVNVAELGPDAAQRKSRLNRLLRERIDAVILSATPDAPVRETLGEAMMGQPLASAVELDGMACDVFGPDYVEAGRLVARQLHARAGNDLLYVWRHDSPGAPAALRGFTEVISQAGLDASAVTVELPASAGRINLGDVLGGRIGTVRGIGASDDFLALQLMMYATSEGRRVGADLAVMGQGNAPCGAAVEPGLTTVDLGGVEAGSRAIELLLQRLSQARLDSPDITRVAPKLIERQSTHIR